MPQFLSNKRLIFLLIGVILLVALISWTLSDRDKVSLPEQIIKDTVGLGQNIVAKPAGYVTGLINSVDDLLNTYDENKRLKSRLEEFGTLQAEVNELEVENKKLQKLLDKKTDLRVYDPIQANVIARNPDQWEEKLILNEGSSNGVKNNMAVLTSEGLVGKVVQTTPYTSEVELLSTNNTNYRVSATVSSKGKEARGLIEGYDAKRGELMLKRIDSKLKIKKGDKVTTSGLGGIFPKGILIGEVTKVTTDDFGLTKLAYVKPAADFQMIDHVVIAKRQAIQVDGSDGDATNKNLSSEGNDK
ncbi:MAG: rod shape-determining protein MreC [Kurthia gibsonii]|uniref:Cell shape-determining protein MreC n=1 Tax=Kurthia gibsonii TaxID=33946 RepID=A0ABU9LLV6_9BACL|nr:MULTISPECIES: rod shape-determining protein MreC [Kurthia]AMA62133.1 rod shape-determining protein MreC [Kurthia sp. 11kri321]MEB6112710.1 rod shape-determining protein MreC [Kurthia gibsonii]MEB7772767.1 rod shape-determining protein MreC [Kurthia gibsonii]RXH52844.1 rod shape-determining protein MreC [Kurthia gibsonii]HZG12900.1 rod shape-determining protein MreC [Kurthia gibsonii]